MKGNQPLSSLEEEYLQTFRLLGIASGPAKVDRINALENVLGFRLPAAYRAYLRVCRTHPPSALIGSSCTIDCIQFNYQGLKELLEEDETNFELPQPCVVFLMHQGYQFNYFPIDGTNDPVVFSFCEGDELPREWSKFSDWVRELRH
ncbi:MAG: hypothetical protein CMJ78_02065 [Planctomycetaceae bacterium]|nr:hypothetical protein [Planctomycetaceae bacterium]